MIPIVVLASGRGSNFEAILQAIKEGQLHAEIRAVVSDQPGAPVLKKAESAGIPSCVVPAIGASMQDAKSAHQLSAQARKELRQAHDQRVLDAIQPYSPRFLVMAGYMRVVTPVLLNAFRSERGYSRIVNIHPSILPAFPGLKGYSQAFWHGTKIAGATVHLVEEGLDSGPICAQKAFSIADCRTEEEVEARGLAVEHELYPEALRWVLPERFDLQWRPAEAESARPAVRRLCVCPN